MNETGNGCAKARREALMPVPMVEAHVARASACEGTPGAHGLEIPLGWQGETENPRYQLRVYPRLAVVYQGTVGILLYVS